LRKIVQTFLKILALIGLSAFATLVAAAVVALRHLVDTPQPLESVLPGDARIYRWRHGHIFYKILGDENTAPLVLLHTPGIGASAYEMRKIVGALAQRYQVYALDLLGFGLSDHPPIDYSADTYVAMCHDFLTEVVAKPATLLASGLSCNYAAIVAKRFPTTCTSLVLLSPSELVGGKQAQQAQHIGTELTGFLLYPLLSTRMALRYALNRQRSPHQAQISASELDYLYATTHQFGAEHAALAWLAGRLAVDASQELDTLHQPTLVIWGARALNDTRAIKNSQNMPTQTAMALIQDAGIRVHEEYPSLVVANILEWSEEGKATVTAAAKKAASPAITPVVKPAAEVEKPVVEEPGTKKASDSREQSLESEADKTSSDADEPLLAYCARCKKKTPMTDVQEVTMKNGNPAVKGKCSICGTGQHRIGRL
jgi:pimeloyl-ACP methyl ester carboxylesterase